MTPSPKTPHLVAAVVASLALAVPAAAGAADSFVGVTDGTKLVQFHSDTLPGLSTPVAIGGLPAGEQLVALDRAPSGDVLAVSTAGTLYALDADRARVTRRVASLAGPIPAEAPTTLAVAADGATARVLAAGRDLTVDLAAGAVTRNDAAPSTAIAADLLPDGTLRGVDAANGHAVSIDGSGAHDLGGLPVALNGATAATTGADGTTWIVTELSRGAKAPEQSRMLRIDASGVIRKGPSSYFLRGLDAIAAVGTVADDTAAPKVAVTIPRQTVAGALKAHGFRVRVRTSEPGQTVMSVRTGRAIAFGLGTVDTPGTTEVVAYAKRSTIQAAAGRKVRVHLAVHDYAGHKTLVDRYLTLAR